MMHFGGSLPYSPFIAIFFPSLPHLPLPSFSLPFIDELVSPTLSIHPPTSFPSTASWYLFFLSAYAPYPQEKNEIWFSLHLCLSPSIPPWGSLGLLFTHPLVQPPAVAAATGCTHIVAPGEKLRGCGEMRKRERNERWSQGRGKKIKNIERWEEEKKRKNTCCGKIKLILSNRGENWEAINYIIFVWPAFFLRPVICICGVRRPVGIQTVQTSIHLPLWLRSSIASCCQDGVR